jgi:hypothetical protein
MSEQTTAAPDTEAFLAELTQLSAKHGLGITGSPVVFVMESGPSGDFEREYRLTEEDGLRFD